MEMNSIAILVGVAIGFAAAMPVAGPISVMVLTRGVNRQFSSGFALAVGGALAEGIYVALALLGFEAYLQPYPFVRPLSLGIGAVLLTVLGIGLLRKRGPVKTEEQTAPLRPAPALLKGFTVAAFNPTLIATWTATVGLVAAQGLVLSGTAAALFTVGVVAGKVLWFGGLLSWLRRKGLRDQTVNRIVRSMGVFALVVAAWFAGSLVA